MTWFAAIQLGVVFAPFAFSWSALVVCVVVYLAAGFGVTLGYHRLLTHRSFRTPKFIEYILSVLGCLSNQGGPLQWVAVHRAHHQHADGDEDPHTPRHGFWWAHMLWWMPRNPSLDEMPQYRHYVADLAKDPVHRFLQNWHWALTLALAGVLFGLGEAWDGVGWSWVVWGIFVRTAVLYHTTWFVNSATHLWGYQNFPTRDRSTNLWWVAIVSLGEGWHNNHHAFPRSARHGMRWFEFDATYYLLRLMALVGLARRIQVPTQAVRRAAAAASAPVEKTGELAPS
jgi:stearoyl-CoA desaturase (delta-9 desaturase)